jgi:hypothetical protein
MARNIGFVKSPGLWEGPIYLKFYRIALHGRTVRYRSSIEDRAFDFYVPYLLLPEGFRDQPPEELVVGIARCRDNVPTPLFHVDAHTAKSVGEPRMYNFSDNRDNSRIYTLFGERREYRMYVTDGIFGRQRAPESLVVQTALSQAVVTTSNGL